MELGELRLHQFEEKESEIPFLCVGWHTCLRVRLIGLGQVKALTPTHASLLRSSCALPPSEANQPRIMLMNVNWSPTLKSEICSSTTQTHFLPCHVYCRACYIQRWHWRLTLDINPEEQKIIFLWETNPGQRIKWKLWLLTLESVSFEQQPFALIFLNITACSAYWQQTSNLRMASYQHLNVPNK